VTGTQAGLAHIFERITGPQAPMAFEAFDGSTSGPADATVRVEIRSPMAVSYLLSSPGRLGIARAYVTGHLAVDGDLYTTLGSLSRVHLDWYTRLEVLRDLGPRYLRMVTPPPEEAPGRLRRALSDLRRAGPRDSYRLSPQGEVSNHFYRWTLGPSMAHSCACFLPHKATLEQAQAARYDLACRTLGLRPGMRLLEVGCGWGGMVMHAARHYGVQALGVTRSRPQAEWAQKSIVEAGLADVAEVRHLDYRDVPEADFDAVSSIGLTERVDSRNLPRYFAVLCAKLRPRGRLLNHCVTRLNTRKQHRAAPLVNRYVFPNGEPEGMSEIVTAMRDNGFEVRHTENLRDNYARTLASWNTNLQTHWDEAVREAGVVKTRAWALHLTGSRLGVERRQIGLHQVLGVRTAKDRMPVIPL
jgi:cyclopropane-fatty-acyl-phospholipid synthase